MLVRFTTSLSTATATYSPKQVVDLSAALAQTWIQAGWCVAVSEPPTSEPPQGAAEVQPEVAPASPAPLSDTPKPRRGRRPTTKDEIL